MEVPWKNPPTALKVPQNPAFARASATGTGAGMNPFSSIGGTSNVGATKKLNRSMGTRKPTLGSKKESTFTTYSVNSRCLVPIERPGPKRMRLERGPSRQALESDPPKIDLSKEHEADDLPVAGPSQPSSRTWRKQKQLEVKPDGPHTQQLTKSQQQGRMQQTAQPCPSDDDDIEEITSTPPVVKKLKAPPLSSRVPVSQSVKVMVADIERRTEIPHPKDLRQHLKHKPAARQSLIDSGTLVPASGSKSRGKKRKHQEYFLPVHQWAYISTKESVLHGSGRVTWEGPRITVSDEGKRVSITVEPDGYKNCILTKASGPKVLLSFRSPIKERPDEASHLFAILDRENNDWSLDAYEDLKTSFKFDDPAASTIPGFWRMAMVEIKEKRKELEEGRVNGKGRESETMSESSKTDASSARRTGPPPPSASAFGRSNSKQKEHRPLLGNTHPSKTATGPPEAGAKPKAIGNTAVPLSVAKKDAAPTLRRSTRQSVAAPPPIEDELILVYPPGVTGAGKININTSDVERLKPGDFLNDTLIEFGLKLWLRELEESNPGLAKQVHVFSSFFYKKLNQKNTEVGYNSVRKWTSKFDLFEKKYIIVPINENMHWYLAIIYEPEHVLRPPPTPEPSPPPSIEEVEIQPVEPVEPVVESMDGPTIVEAEDPTARYKTSSEAGVEEELTVNLTQSLSIVSDNSDIPDPKEIDVQDAEEIDVMNVDSPPAAAPDAVPPDAPPSVTREHTPEIPETPSHTVSKESREDEADVLNIAEGDAPEDVDMTETTAVDIETVPTGRFYGAATVSTRSGKQYEKPKPKPKPKKAAPVEVYRPKHTYILTFDSLGQKHGQAGRQLTKYLFFEAKDKKGYDSTAPVQIKAVNVPTQPNFCDCGLYLIHLAQTFISNPSHYMEKVFSTTPRTPNELRQEIWLDEKVPNMRENLKSHIRELSIEWKKTQPSTSKPVSKVKEKEKEKEANKAATEPSSDSDIEITEHNAPPAKGKGKQKQRQGAAARLR